MAKKDQYLIMSNREPDSVDNIADSIRETMCVCGTFAKAYRVGLTLGRINKPNIKYRKSLETIKIQKHCSIEQLEGPEKITIVKIKSH